MQQFNWERWKFIKVGAVVLEKNIYTGKKVPVEVLDPGQGDKGMEVRGALCRNQGDSKILCRIRYMDGRTSWTRAMDLEPKL